MRTWIKDSRGVPHARQDKAALRLIEQYYEQNPKTKPGKPYVLAGYLVLTWVASNKQSDAFKTSLGKLAQKIGCSKETAIQALKLLEFLRLIKKENQQEEETGEFLSNTYELLDIVAVNQADRVVHQVDNPLVNQDNHVVHQVDNIEESLYKKNHKNRTFPSPLPSSQKTQPEKVVNNSVKGKKGKRENGKVDKDLFEQLRSGIYRNDLFSTYDNLLRIKTIEQLAEDAAYTAIKSVLRNNEEFLRERYGTSYSRFPKDETAEIAAKRFPYDKLPDSSDEDARRNFFVSAVCNTAAEVMAEALEEMRGIETANKKPRINHRR